MTTPKGENSNTYTQNQEAGNMKHFGKSTVFPADSENDRLCYKIEKLSMEELSDSTSKAISCKKGLPSSIILGVCEKNELSDKPDRRTQETLITLHEKGNSQATSESDQKLLSETDNHHKNIMVIKGQVIDAIQEHSYTAGDCKTNHRSDAEEMITTKTECSNPPGALHKRTKTNSSSSVLIKRKQQQIMKKKLEKDEKRRQRELEFLKNLLPKDKRVQIVDQNTFQKILKDSDPSQNERKSLGLSFDEFPALNVLKNEDKFTTNLNQRISVVQRSKTAREFDTRINDGKQYKRASESHSAAIHKMINKIEMPGESDRTLNHVTQQKSVSQSHSAVTQELLHKYKIPREFDGIPNLVKHYKSISESNSVATHEAVHKNEMKIEVSTKIGINDGVRKAGKPPKKHDPIKIDILQCIKVVKPKNTNINPKKRSSILKRASRVKESSLIGGNELDSSNPQRSKGKKREQPRRRRTTKLKEVILQERALKKKLKELETKKLSQENQEQKEVHVCTSDIVATDPHLNHIKYEDSTQECEDQCPFQSRKDFTPAAQESAGVDNLLSLNKIKKEEPEVDSEKYCLSVASDDGTQSALHQEKPSTYKASDNLSRYTEEILGLHHRKFRPYCDHMITDEINSSVRSLLQDIVKFHDRLYERDPVKANARRRHITGLREVLKHLSLKRLKLIIIAPDLELIEGKGGILDIVEQLKEGAKSQEIPHVFALNRRTLGRITFKKVSVSCIGVISYDGTEKNFHALMEALPEARKQYQEALANAVHKHGCNTEVDVNKEVIASILSKLAEKSTLVPGEQTEEKY